MEVKDTGLGVEKVVTTITCVIFSFSMYCTV